MKSIKYYAVFVLLLILAAASISCSAGAVNTELPTSTTEPPATSNEPVKTQSSNITSPELTNTGQIFPYEWHLNEWIIHGIETVPENAITGEPVRVWTNIYSANSDYSFAGAFLIINGELVDSRKLIIPPDEDFPFLFEFTPGLPGDYDICVRVICETKIECTDPFDTEAYLVDAFITIPVKD